MDGSEEGGAQGRVCSRLWARSPRRPSPTSPLDLPEQSSCPLRWPSPAHQSQPSKHPQLWAPRSRQQTLRIDPFSCLSQLLALDLHPASGTFRFCPVCMSSHAPSPWAKHIHTRLGSNKAASTEHQKLYLSLAQDLISPRSRSTVQAVLF